MSDSIARLHAAIQASRAGDVVSGRAAKLLSEGTTKIAKKMAEEAVEVGLEAVQGKREAVVSESVDLIYNLCVLWVNAGIRPEDIWREMERRERLLGIAGKLPKAVAGLRDAGLTDDEDDDA